MPLIKLPQGYQGLNVQCRCSCRGQTEHCCFALGSPRLRGYCPPCFEAQVVDPARNEAHMLHNAYHAEMTRIHGFRIRNEGSYEKWAAIEAKREPAVGGQARATRSRDEEVY